MYITSKPRSTRWLVTHHYYNPKIEESIFAMRKHVLSLYKAGHLLLGGAVWCHKATVPFAVPILREANSAQ